MTLKERLKNIQTARGGEFSTCAMVSQQIKNAMLQGSRWGYLPPLHREALDMIAHKIAEITCTEDEFKDAWRSIAQFAEYVEQMGKDNA